MCKANGYSFYFLTLNFKTSEHSDSFILDQLEKEKTEQKKREKITCRDLNLLIRAGFFTSIKEACKHYDVSYVLTRKHMKDYHISVGEGT